MTNIGLNIHSDMLVNLTGLVILKVGIFSHDQPTSAGTRNSSGAV
jgi:hypothetical protein